MSNSSEVNTGLVGMALSVVLAACSGNGTPSSAGGSDADTANKQNAPSGAPGKTTSNGGSTAFTLGNKSILEDGTLTLTDADIIISGEGKGDTAFAFDHAGVTGVACSTVGTFSAFNAADGTFTYSPGPDWNGVCNVRLILTQGSTKVGSQFALTVSPVNDPPSAPTTTSVAPALADKSSTFTCAYTGGADVDGDALTPIYYWYNGVVLIPAATNSTFSDSTFSKGDTVSCRVALGDASLVSPATASSVVTLRNSVPTQVATVSIMTLQPDVLGSFECAYTGGSDLDGDTLTPIYSWKIDNSAIPGATGNTLTSGFAKGQDVTCEVSVSDGLDTGEKRASVSMTVQNSPPTGTVTCSPTHAIVSQGSALNVTCSGGADADVGDSLTYESQTIAGSCPSLSSGGTISTTAASPSDCTFQARACDGTACTPWSSNVKTSVFALTVSLGSPSQNACEVNFTSTTTPSSNLSNLTYGHSGGAVFASSTFNSGNSVLSVRLAEASTVAGTFGATLGVTSGNVNGAIGSTSVFSSTASSSFIVALGAPGSTAPFNRPLPGATLAANASQGLEALYDGSTACVNCSGQRGSIAVGSGTICAAGSTGSAHCWGSDDLGTIGNGATTGTQSYATPVNGLTSGVAQLASGGGSICALKTDGSVHCWGTNLTGSLGMPGGSASAPQAVTPLSSGVVSLAAGYPVGDAATFCALLSSGQVRCWGANLEAQLGVGNRTNSDTPLTMTRASDSEPLENVAQIAVGRSNVCMLRGDGTVWCTGSANSTGVVYSASGDRADRATQIAGLADIRLVALSNGHDYSHSADYACAINSTGNVSCWGSNTFGTLGIAPGTTPSSHTPLQISGLSNNVDLALAGKHACALERNGKVWCWGTEENGRLGNGVTTSTQKYTAQAVHNLDGGTPDTTPLSDGVAISAGGNRTCVLTRASTLKCWGESDWASLGDGTGNSYSRPVVVKADSTTNFAPQLRTCNQISVSAPPN